MTHAEQPGAAGGETALPAFANRADLDRLLGAYYDEFRRVARRVLGGNAGAMHIQPTELVHEAAMRILAAQNLSVRDQAHFMALGVRIMRMTMIDEIRRRKAGKRGADVMTSWKEPGEPAADFDIEEFDSALERLAEIEPEGAKIVELRFFAGMTVEEIGVALGLSESTVNRRWRSARAWLFRKLEVG